MISSPQGSECNVMQRAARCVKGRPSLSADELVPHAPVLQTEHAEAMGRERERFDALAAEHELAERRLKRRHQEVRLATLLFGGSVRVVTVSHAEGQNTAFG